MQSNPPVPKFYAVTTQVTAFDSLSRIIPHSFHKDHAHPKNSRLESNQVWLKLHLVQFRGYGYSNRFILCAEVYNFTHTIRLFSPGQGVKERNEARILHQSS